LSFSQYTSGGLDIEMIPQWKDQGFNAVSALWSASDRVSLGGSPLEKAVGGSDNDFVYDYGGTADRIDLRPLESSDVSFGTPPRPSRRR
jgi:hypothetical protein